MPTNEVSTPFNADPRKEIFAQSISSGMTQSDAAKAAGYQTSYPEKTGSRLVRNVQVRARIEDLVQQALEEHGISPSYIISQIKNAIEAAEHKPVVSRVSGEIVGYDQDGRTILQGCELLGKMMGVFMDRSEEANNQPLGMSATERRIYLIGYFKQHKMVIPGYTEPEDIIIDAPKAE